TRSLCNFDALRLSLDFVSVAPRVQPGSPAVLLQNLCAAVWKAYGVKLASTLQPVLPLDIQWRRPYKPVVGGPGMIRNTWRPAARIAPLALVAVCGLWLLKPAAGQAQRYGRQNGERRAYAGDHRRPRPSPRQPLSAAPLL